MMEEMIMNNKIYRISIYIYSIFFYIIIKQEVNMKFFKIIYDNTIGLLAFNICAKLYKLQMNHYRKIGNWSEYNRIHNQYLSWLGSL